MTQRLISDATLEATALWESVQLCRTLMQCARPYSDLHRCMCQLQTRLVYLARRVSISSTQLHELEQEERYLRQFLGREQSPSTSQHLAQYQ